MIFLLGPPGAGKTVLGDRACKELGLRFRALVARYRRSLGGFARFLKECGDLPKNDT